MSARPVVLVACFAMLLAGAGPAQSGQAPAASDAARRAEERIRALQREADALAGQERTLLGDLRRLEIERTLRTEQVKDLEQKLAQTERERADTGRRLAELDSQARAQQPDLQDRFVALYKLGHARYLRLLLDVDNLRSVGRAYRTTAALASGDRRRATHYTTTVEQLRRDQRRLQEQAARYESLQEEAQQARAQADRAVAARNKLIAQIDQRRDLNAQLVGELRAAAQKLHALPPALQAGTETILPIRTFRGDLDWPITTGRLAARFGQQRDPRFGTTDYHAGIEIAAPEGSPVRAIHDGVVAYARPFTGFGSLVILDHGGQAYSLYGNLSAVSVEQGARVTRGQAVGTTGAAPGGKPSLYFELRIDGKPVDPLQWLKGSLR